MAHTRLQHCCFDTGVMYHILFYSVSVSLNLLIPKSDWHLIFPYSNTLNQTLRSENKENDHP